MSVATKPSWARVEGPLAPYAYEFRSQLEAQGYTLLTAAGHIRLMAHLSRWMQLESLELSALTPQRVEEYFAVRRASGYVNERTAGALVPLVGFLQQCGILPACEPVAPQGPVEVLLARYAQYLRVERGLAERTIQLNVHLVRAFVAEHVQAADEGDVQVVSGGLDARRIGGYVVEQCERRPASAGRIATALRSLLTFWYVDGLVDRPLADLVPKVAAYSQQRLPRALEAEQVDALLSTCDLRTASGRRNRAVMLLMVRLGLRAGEVAALGLDDIDWRRGEVQVAGKAGRQERLPLPSDVGEAVVAYLQDGRPNGVLSREVFIRLQAPYRGLTTAAISTVVAVAGRRAGLGKIGAHQLRHTAATAMLRAGGGLEEIGNVLRHSRIATTAIYAKVDRDALRTIARPWPRGEHR